MSVTFRGYVGEVVISIGEKIFYTLDTSAEGVLWKNADFIAIKGIPIGAYCWALDYEDEVIYNGRRRMI
jgi:hypothetical protein